MSKLLITITEEDCIFKGNIKQEKIVTNTLKIYNEGAYFSTLFKNGLWDGFTKFYRGNKFKYGLLDVLIPVLRSENIDYQIIDNTIREDFKIYKLNPLLFTHQKNATRSFLKEKFGIIVVPTRGGKTYISAEIIRQIQIKLKNNLCVLFLVDGIDLFKQTVSELSTYLGIEQDDVGKFNDKNFFIKNINVGMIQSLAAARKGKNIEKTKILNLLLRKTNFLIIDECHEYSSTQRSSFIKAFKNLQFRLALSATPFKDSLNHRFTSLQNLGRVIYRISRKELVKAGVLSDDKAFLIKYENANNAEDNYQDELKKSIYENNERSNLIFNLIKICTKNNLKVLVLFNSKVFGNNFSELTGYTFISGDDKSHIREIEKTNFLTGNSDVLLASNIFKKGITLPEAQVILLADGGQESSTIMQKRGRVLGTTKNKNRALLIDIMDLGLKYLSDHALSRLELYDLEFGKNKIEVYGDLESEFLELEESLKEWFNV
jgi:superfamily II DNA or RNA helicase